MADGDDRVELTDLDVISRYSLAVRAATADRADLIATLRSDLDWLESLGRPVRRAPQARPEPPVNAQPVKSPPAPTVKRAPAKKAAARKTAAKKTAGRRR